MPPEKDSRAKRMNRTQLGLENQSLVFSVFDETSKLTVNDAVEAVRAKQEEASQPPLNERTVRRAIEALVNSGFLVQVGRAQSGANLFTKQSTAMVDPGNGIIPLNGELVSVEKFLRFIAENEEPFKLKYTTINDKATLGLRKAFLFAVITAGEAGHNSGLKTVHATLQAYANELEYAKRMIEGFLNSPIWYANYRDRMALGVRDTQKNDADLFQLCYDIVKGG